MKKCMFLILVLALALVFSGAFGAAKGKDVIKIVVLMNLTGPWASITWAYRRCCRASMPVFSPRDFRLMG